MPATTQTPAAADTATAAAAAAAPTPTFVHRPRPAILPANPQHAWQRRFGAPGTDAGFGLQCHNPLDPLDPYGARTQIEVFRSAFESFASIKIQIGMPAVANVSAHLTPAQLRALAASLIDAAHAIELHPATTEGGAA